MAVVSSGDRDVVHDVSTAIPTDFLGGFGWAAWVAHSDTSCNFSRGDPQQTASTFGEAHVRTIKRTAVVSAPSSLSTLSWLCGTQRHPKHSPPEATAFLLWPIKTHGQKRNQLPVSLACLLWTTACWKGKLLNLCCIQLHGSMSETWDWV